MTSLKTPISGHIEKPRPLHIPSQSCDWPNTPITPILSLFRQAGGEMRRFWIIAATALCIFGANARAQSPVVVELFTSQGCSSCPPADALLAQLAEREDVIGLALHVDYWDYIGWRDRFAHPAFTARQKGYVRAGGWKMIYTPQVVVNGRRAVVGNRAMDVTHAISDAARNPSPLRLTLRRDGTGLHISADTPTALPEADIHLIRYEDHEEVHVTRGENAGRTLSYSHVVHDWKVIGQWDGHSPIRASLPISGDDPIVVLIQGKGYGPILAAARLR